MRTLSIDIETYSPVSLLKGGVYKYAQHPQFRVLLFAYSIDEGPVQIIDLEAEGALPAELTAALTDPTVIKNAFNAQFERVCLGAMLGTTLDPAQWRCSMIRAAYLGLPLSLADVAKALKLDDQKDPRGKKLIKYFCTPAAKDGNLLSEGGRNLPSSDPQGWDDFKQYCIKDVEVELAIQKALAPFPVPDAEWENYTTDQRINDRGIRIDTALARAAIGIDTRHRDKLMGRAIALTGLDNPNSPMQLKEWLCEHGCPVEGLAKADVEAAMKTATGDALEVLRIRQELARSSVKKYRAMVDCAGNGDRARALIQFYGAARTGRYAGRLVQVQNLPRNYLSDLALARQLVRESNTEALEMLFDPLPDTLSQLVRTAFIPSEGCRFIIADYSAIEARVIAWLAGEQWRIDLFKQGGDIYCQSASAMFGVPVEKHGQNSHLRQKGKIAELACGYGGAAGALKAMGALNMGLKEDELQPLVTAWRDANPHIVALWSSLENAATRAIKTHQPQQVGPIGFTVQAGMLRVTLPSGRQLTYQKPALGENRFGGTSITYWGIGANRRFTQLETYGGKLTENIIQAIARDLLAHAMNNLERAGYQTVMHVHDEVVIDAPKHSAQTLDEACQIMCDAPAWADGLPLNADGFEADYYMKD